MNKTLRELIDGFRNAQDYAVNDLLVRLGIPRPATARDWVVYCSQEDLHSQRNIDGVDVCAHGYGIELRHDGFVLDFDWGESGEADGFDGWRLYLFACEHHPDLGCSHKEINGWLESAIRENQLIRDHNLYYNPHNRSS